MRRFLTTPCDVTRPIILMLYKQDAGSLGEKSRSSLAAGIVAWLLLKISLFFRSISTSRIYKFAKGALLQLPPHCTTSVNSYNFQLSFYNKSTYFPQGLVIGSLEYQFLSVQHEPEPASPWNQPVGQHRRTWLWTSYSGYNNMHSFSPIRTRTL